MADQDRPNQNANKSKAEGERDVHPERLYDDEDSDNAGGITNRPLSDEIGNQQALPERGTSKEQTRNPDATRKEGDYEEDER